MADDFIPAIEALLGRDRKPDHIIVETSGLALPKPLVKAFDWPAIRARLTVASTVGPLTTTGGGGGGASYRPVRGLYFGGR